MKITAKLLIFLLIITGSSFAGGNNRPHKDSLNLIGKIFNNTSTVKNVVINIYDGNKKIKSIHVKSSNRFVCNLPLNSLLTVEITAKNYHTKRFIIDSNIDFKPKSPLKYDFDIDIFQEKELAGINPSYLDFPVGIVSYDKKKESFHRNKKYTKQIKKTYLKLWEESQNAERQAEGLD